MFSKLAIFSTLALPLLAAATPVAPIAARQSATDACCSSLISPVSTLGETILTTLGLPAQDVSSLLGLACTPLDAVSGIAGASSCSSGTAAASCSGGLLGGGLLGNIGLGCLPLPLPSGLPLPTSAPASSSGGLLGLPIPTSLIPGLPLGL